MRVSRFDRSIEQHRATEAETSLIGDTLSESLWPSGSDRSGGGRAQPWALLLGHCTLGSYHGKWRLVERFHIGFNDFFI